MNRFALGLAVAFFSSSALAQIKPRQRVAPRPRAALPAPPENQNAAARSEGAGTELVFPSGKVWRSARWYVVGRWHAADEIVWLGGGRTRIRYGNPKCGNVEGLGFVARAERAGDLEVLRSGVWTLIEVSPNVQTEAFTFSVPGADADCRREAKVTYAWSGAREGVKPLLFLQPANNRYFGATFHVRPDIPAEKADIQLDLLLGGAKGKFPNADTANGASSSFYLAPMAIARGEWLLPFFRDVGLNLGLEQTVANFGGAPLQNVFFSDWNVGAFYQRLLPVANGFLLRGGFKFHNHVADDNKELRSLADSGVESKGFLLGASATLYFADAWLVGADFDYGLPSSMAGRGKSSMMDFTGRFGLRVTGFLYLLGELGYRTYANEAMNTDSLLRFSGGLRFDL